MVIVLFFHLVYDPLFMNIQYIDHSLNIGLICISWDSELFSFRLLDKIFTCLLVLLVKGVSAMCLLAVRYLLYELW